MDGHTAVMNVVEVWIPIVPLSPLALRRMFQNVLASFWCLWRNSFVENYYILDIYNYIVVMVLYLSLLLSLLLNIESYWNRIEYIITWLTRQRRVIVMTKCIHSFMISNINNEVTFLPDFEDMFTCYYMHSMFSMFISYTTH